MLTIGRVFQLNVSEAVTLAQPYWRDTCLSLALAKMLRRRFAKLPLDEAGCSKALDFVLKDLIEYIGRNEDIQTGSNLQKHPTERVFSIIQEELLFVSDFLHIKVPTYNYFHRFIEVDAIGFIFMSVSGSYLVKKIAEWSNAWQILVAGGLYNYQCFIHGSVMANFFSILDKVITFLLVSACTYIQYAGVVTAIYSRRWDNFCFAKKYIENPANWDRYYLLLPKSNRRKLLYWLANCLKNVLRKVRGKNVKEPRFCFSVLDLKAETILFCIKVDVSIFANLPKWIRRIIPISTPSVFHSTDAKETILWFFRNNGGGLTNGETSLETYGMEHLKWACQPNGSTTEAILVWHIATTLFHHQKPSPQQNNDPHEKPAPQQNNNPFKEREVALSLSSYCHYLVKYLPELLPDEVEWTNERYESVRKELLDIALFTDRKPTEKQRCEYALQAMWVESSIVGKGAILAKDLMECSEEGKQVWVMLAEFWAEMMLFISPSDNVEAHEKILERGELITQLWALLTHAGIVTRPKPTEHQNHENESNAVTGDMNV